MQLACMKKRKCVKRMNDAHHSMYKDKRMNRKEFQKVKIEIWKNTISEEKNEV